MSEPNKSLYDSSLIYLYAASFQQHLSECWTIVRAHNERDIVLQINRFQVTMIEELISTFLNVLKLFKILFDLK